MQGTARLTIVGLGPGHPDALTLGAARALEQAEALVLRTGRHGVAAWLSERRIAYDTLDSLYEDCQDFDALCERAAQTLLTRLREVRTLCYAVSDPGQDATVARLLELLEPSEPQEPQIEVRVLPGVSQGAYAQAGAQTLRARIGANRQTTALALEGLEQDPSLPLCVTEIDGRMLASRVKLWLLERLPAETAVIFLPPGEAAEAAPLCIPLEELDRQPAYDHTAALWAPAADRASRERFGFSDLVEILRILRAPDGCPWDREQTHETLRPYLLEEAYEAVEAIDSGESAALADELGDVLLQVVFHAQIGAQHGAFAIDDVTTAICRKLITRHAHIFGEIRCDTAEDVLRSWERIKRRERGQTTQAEALRGVSKALPALMRAAKVQKKAADVGFDWARPQQALEKVLEEASELRAELDAGADPNEEGGDLLFAAVNVLRLAGAQPELALSAATEKFIARFARMEALILADGGRLEGMSLAEMDAYWDRIKREARASGG